MRDSLLGDCDLGREPAVATIVDQQQPDDPLFIRGDDTTDAGLAQRHRITFGLVAIARDERTAVQVDRRTDHRRKIQSESRTPECRGWPDRELQGVPGSSPGVGSERMRHGTGPG